MKLIIHDLDNNVVDVIICKTPISKCIKETKKKYPPGKYTATLTF